jgi:hypothetical protein
VDEHQSSAPAHPSSRKKLPKPDDMIEAHYASLERQELRDRVLKLRRRFGL